jgi:hypothetical protein
MMIDEWEPIRGFAERGPAEAFSAHLEFEHVPTRIEAKALENAIEARFWVLVPRTLAHRALGNAGVCHVGRRAGFPGDRQAAWAGVACGVVRLESGTGQLNWNRYPHAVFAPHGEHHAQVRH